MRIKQFKPMLVGGTVFSSATVDNLFYIIDDKGKYLLRNGNICTICFPCRESMSREQVLTDPESGWFETEADAIANCVKYGYPYETNQRPMEPAVYQLSKKGEGIN